MQSKLLNRRLMEQEYESGMAARKMVAQELEERVETIMARLASHLSVKGRVKSFESYYRKYLRYAKAASGACPLQIPDKIGLRIICPFIEDIGFALDAIKESFEVLEVEYKGGDYSFKEFGYESIHLLIKTPDDIRKKYSAPGEEVAEIQIRTILQDAWAEVEHELVYKADFTPFDDTMKRKLAALNASLSLADTIFQEIRVYQRRLNEQLGKRRRTFFKKIEESTDDLLFEGETETERADDADFHLPATSNTNTLDDILLNALYAHNKGHFDEAVTFYSRILTLKADAKVVSLVYKHRGMAYFAQSRYDEAVADFSDAFKADPGAYKALYYRGVVHAVQARYDEAVSDFTQSLEVQPYNNYCLYRRAQAYYHLGDYTAALADCEAALAISADFDIALKLRALLLDKLKM